jgi:hypothetical protein
MDDLPIRPSKEYLEQQELLAKQRAAKTSTDYLKKSKPRYMPSSTAAQLPKKSPEHKKQSPSKKAIYERIKSHNQMLKAKYATD